MKDWITRHQPQALLLWNSLGLIIASLVMLSPLIRSHPLWALGVFLFFLLWSNLGSRYFARLRMVQFQQVTNALYNGCDPQPLLEMSEQELAATPPRRSNLPYLGACAANRMTALYALGRFAEAIDACPAGPLAPADPASQLVLQVNLANLHLAMNHPDLAQEVMARAQALLEGLPADHPSRPLCQDAIDSFDIALRLLQGDIEGLLPTLESGLETADTEYQRVGAHFQLGRYYLKADRPDLARPHFAYAAEHGNRLFYRSDAQDYLARLDQGE